MPTYGYRCTVCSHEFERFQKISDPAVTNCESCGETVKKILYPVGIQFKGSGFYVNDYAKSSAPSESAKSDSAAAAAKTETTPTASGSTETKPAAAPAPAAPSSTSGNS